MLLRVSFLFLFFFQFIFAQYSPSVNYTTAQGLPNNAIRSLFIDNVNQLWIGTENGVTRLENGVFFTLDISIGLGHNSCWDISQDDKGNMWFASYGGGVSKFNGKMVPFGFQYNSGKNDSWLTVEEIRNLIKTHIDPNFTPG